jgi:penicillin-binding protein 1A
MKTLIPIASRLLLSPRFWKYSMAGGLITGITLAISPAWDALQGDPKLALIPRQGQRLTDRKGNLYLRWPEYGNPTATQPSDMPKDLVNAVMAREDQRFLTHFGVDVLGLCRALVNDVCARRIKQGGSTLTMQLVEMTYNRPEVSIKERLQAKVFEVIMAARIELAAKQQTGDAKQAKLLTMSHYLDRIPFGNNCIGIQKAADSTFGKSVSKLNLGESAYLAGLIRAPTANNVYHNKDNACAARDAVVKNMLKLGMITRQQAQDAKFFAREKPKPQKRQGDGFTTKAVKKELSDLQNAGLIPLDILAHEDMEIQINLDVHLQDAARDILVRRLTDIEKLPGFHADSGKPLNGSITILDNATGDVLSCVGGRDFDIQQMNLATQGVGRPFASPVKVFDYAAFLEATGSSIDYRMSNGPLSAGEAMGYAGKTAPHESLPEGVHPLWVGLKDSSNRMAIRASILAGSYHWSRVMRDMGLLNGIAPKDTSLFLGNLNVRPMTAASAYACIARRGSYITPRFIRRILVNGKEIYASKDKPHSVLCTKTCDELTKGLREVLRSGTAAQFGGKDLARRFPLAGKTGTTDDCTDAWFCGYSSSVTVVVWIGFPHGAKTIIPSGSGGSLAFPVWKGIIEELAKRRYAFKALPELQKPPVASTTASKARPSTKSLVPSQTPKNPSSIAAKATPPVRSYRPMLPSLAESR